MKDVLILFCEESETFLIKNMESNKKTCDIIKLGDRFLYDENASIWFCFLIDLQIDKLDMAQILCKYLRLCLLELPPIRPKDFNVFNFLIKKIATISNIKETNII